MAYRGGRSNRGRGNYSNFNTGRGAYQGHGNFQGDGYKGNNYQEPGPSKSSLSNRDRNNSKHNGLEACLGYILDEMSLGRGGGGVPIKEEF